MALVMPPAQASKPEWRLWAREARTRVPEHSAAVCSALTTFLHGQGVRRVLAYRALPGEPDISSLAAEFELLTSRARFRPQPHLTLHAWDTATELSRFGALQPPADAPRVALETVDAALLPALAFDERGVRLGYGGGFYDRLLPDFRGLVVGVVWSALVVPELPLDPHDVRARFLATETGVRASQP